MNSVRTYGNPPYKIALVHGGPGAAGEMAPVARELSKTCSVLEPLQTANTLDGQVEELKTQLESYSQGPLTLAGYSWGAWLALITTARHPKLTSKLVLISSGPLAPAFVNKLGAARMQRLTLAEQEELMALLKVLEGDDKGENKDAKLKRLGELAAKTDLYDPAADERLEGDMLGLDGRLYQQVWNQAAELRSSGELLRLAVKLSCPVLAIHGDYDPHPAEGVREPLEQLVKDFEFVLLKNCGHTPWRESQAREQFYEVLVNHLSDPE